MVKVVRVPISDATTADELHDELARLGAAAMVEALTDPDAPGIPQPAYGVTYARKIDKAEARIDFAKSATDVRNHIHGLSPFPGAWLTVNGARIKVLKARVVETKGRAGQFVDERLTVACGEGAVQLLTLQREGKAAMDAETFVRGFPVAAGTMAS
jgi:methionyl-tRNA formyltransferase